MKHTLKASKPWKGKPYKNSDCAEDCQCKKDKTLDHKPKKYSIDEAVVKKSSISYGNSWYNPNFTINPIFKEALEKEIKKEKEYFHPDFVGKKPSKSKEIKIKICELEFLDYLIFEQEVQFRLTINPGHPIGISISRNNAIELRKILNKLFPYKSKKAIEHKVTKVKAKQEKPLPAKLIFIEEK